MSFSPSCTLLSSTKNSRQIMDMLICCGLLWSSLKPKYISPCSGVACWMVGCVIWIREHAEVLQSRLIFRILMCWPPQLAKSRRSINRESFQMIPNVFFRHHHSWIFIAYDAIFCRLIPFAHDSSGCIFCYQTANKDSWVL